MEDDNSDRNEKGDGGDEEVNGSVEQQYIES